MNTTNVHVQITEFGRIAADLDAITSAADDAIWRDAAVALRERTYVADGGAVRVRADWSALAQRDDAQTLQLDCEVVDERASPDRRDLLSFVELFLHEAYLLVNLAVPGALSGTFVALSSDAHRASEIALHARVFEYAWAAAARDGASRIDVLPLRDVVRWYDGLGLATSQIATEGVPKALFHLLHLARRDEDEAASIVHLGHALAAIGVTPDEHFNGLYREQTNGSAPLFHPMADDALDPRVEELSLAWIEAADAAAVMLVSALQARIRR